MVMCDHVSTDPVETKTGKELFFESLIMPHQQRQDVIAASNLTGEQKLWAALETEHPQVAQAFYDIKAACPSFVTEARTYMGGAHYIIAPSFDLITRDDAIMLSVRKDEAGKMAFLGAGRDTLYTRIATQEFVAIDIYNRAVALDYIRVRRTVSLSGKPVCSIEPGPALRL